MCVSFIVRRLQPLLGEKNAKDQSYTAYFRPDKRELNELYQEIEYARDFLWCIDMIYESKLPAMNINSISLAPHAADRAAENQDRRKWVSWMKEIEKKAEKDVMIEFFQNKYCTMHEIERELEKYPEDFVVGEEPTWWVMGSSKTEPPRKTERQQKTASSSGQRSQTAGGSVPQPGASSGGSQASDAVKIDNEIIDSIFRMNSGGDDDRWVQPNCHFTHIPRSLLISILLGILLPSSMAFFTKFPKKIAACLDFPTGTQKNSFVLTTVGLAVILMIFSRTRKTQNKQLQMKPRNCPNTIPVSD